MNNLKINAVAAPPLTGLRVIDFSRQIAGPYAAMLLGDLGADVIKIEQPRTGDDSRRLAPACGDMSSVFIAMNRNKRSIELNLKSKEGCAIAAELIASADIVVDNFLYGVMERMGLGYETLAERHPRLIYCAITAFGHKGAFAKRPGFDPVTQADCGLFSLNGHPDRPPVRIAAPAIDVSTGLTALNAIQAALYNRFKTGRGQRVEVAMFDVGVALSAYFPISYMLTGSDLQRSGNQSQVGSPSGLFTASDGDFFMSCSTDRMFSILVREIMDLPKLADDKAFYTNGERVKNNDSLIVVLSAAFITKTRSEWVELMLEKGIPAGSIRSIAEAVESDEAKDRGIFTRIEHPALGPLPNVAPPFQLDGSPLAPARIAPNLGQHTDDILEEYLGYDAPQIAALRANGTL